MTQSNDKSPERSLEPVARAGRPLTKGNFFPVLRNGMGDPANAYPHCMAWHGGYLYVGVTRYCYHAYRPYDLGAAFQVFPVKLREFNWELDWRARIWRYDPRGGQWENLYVSPMCMGKMGFEVARHIGFRDMAVFQGESDSAPALYTASWGSQMGLGPFILRCSNGRDFDEVGVSDRRFFGTQTLRSLVAFKDRLFTIPTGRDSGEDGVHQFKIGIVLESRDPARGGWRPASEPFFGDPGNIMLFEMETFNGFLYVGTMNPHEGFQLWKTDAEGDPPYRWKRVLSHGAFRGKLNEGVCSLCAFGNHLYVGTGIWAGGFDRIHNVGPAAPELIRLDQDDRWDLVAGESRDTPDGLKIALSGFGSGFNNLFAGYIWRMCEHDGWLYVSTFVWSPWLPFAKQERWPEIIKSRAAWIPLDNLIENYGGFDLWRSRDGETWTNVMRDGFGNPFNCGGRTMASTPHGLFVGAVNPFGPEVAVRRVAGWRYEDNPRGGMEVWLGSHDHPHHLPAFTSSRPAVPLEREALLREMSEPAHRTLLREFYDNSGWHHIGFWEARIRSPKEACENLLEHLLSFTLPEIPPGTRSLPDSRTIEEWRKRRSAGEEPSEHLDTQRMVVDRSVCSWVTTRHLLRYFSPHQLVTVLDDDQHQEHAARTVPGARLVVSRLPKLRLPSRTCDIFVSIEALNRCKNRKKFLKEAFRVLKPGGRLICTDFNCGEKGRSAPNDVKAYEELLARIGFSEIKVTDETNSCSIPFKRYCDWFVNTRINAMALKDDVVAELRACLPDRAGLVQSYFLIWACKGD